MGSRAFDPRVNSYNLKQTERARELMPCQPRLLPAAKPVCGLQTIPAQETLQPQQAGEKPLALIAGTSKRTGKPRNRLGKYVVLLK